MVCKEGSPDAVRGVKFFIRQGKEVFYNEEDFRKASSDRVWLCVCCVCVGAREGEKSLDGARRVCGRNDRQGESDGKTRRAKLR